MDTRPSQLKQVMEQAQLHEADVLHWVLCDRTITGEYVDTCVLLTNEALWIAHSDQPPARKKVYKGYMHSKKERRLEAAPMTKPSWTIESLPLDDVEAISVVNLVASGMIVLKQENGKRVVAAFTNGHMGRAAKLASLFDKRKKKETIEQLDLDQEQQTSCPKCGMVYPEENRQVCPKCLKRHAIFLRLLSYAGNYRASIVWIVMFMLLNSATALVIPYLQGTVLFDQALGGEGYFAGKIGLVIMLMIVFRLLSTLFGVLYGVINSKLGANVAYDLKATIFSAMQLLSLSFFQRKQTGQLMTRVNNDATELQYFFVDGMSYFIVNAMNIVGIVIVMLVLDWKLTLICFVPFPIVLYIVSKLFPRLWRLSWRRHRKVSAMNSIISDTLRGTRVVKAFGKERSEIERFQFANDAFSYAEQRYNKMGGTIFPMLNMLTQLSSILIWAFGGWFVLQGQFSFGQVFTFVTYMHMLYGPIQFMNNIVGWWSVCMSAAQRIFEIQDSVPEVVEKEHPIVLDTIRGEIEVNNIVFGYEPNKAILNDVSMRAKPGQMIGIVGHSGAGKSTLVNLISRLYDVNDGEIRIDGHNIKDIASSSLRKQIGIVSQDVYVFSGTIAENIAYANENCTLDEIIYAAKIANAHDFIEKLPDGYDTLVGTGVHNLSGGEKQRLSIARAILHNPKILILDEATASLDTETELQIQEALDTLVEGRTTIAIAHRLSTLRNADYLIVMEGGKVVEAGMHEELMLLEGAYFNLVKKHDEALKMKEGIIA